MGRKAALPSRGVKRRPIWEAVSIDGLTVTWLPDGAKERQVIDLSNWRGHEKLRKQLAGALAVRTGPTGTWNSIASVNNAGFAIKTFLAWCSAVGLTSLEDMSNQHWIDFCEYADDTLAASTAHQRKLALRAVLQDSDTLPKRTRWTVSNRVGSAPRPMQESYTEAEFLSLQREARKALAKAHRRIRRTVQRGTRDNASGHVVRDWLAGREVLPSEQRHQLMLTAEEAIAAAVVLICQGGYNSSTLLRLPVPDFRPGQGNTDGDVMINRLDKPRRGSHKRSSAEAVVDHGDDSHGRSYRLIIEATQPARDLLESLGIPIRWLLIYGSEVDAGRYFDGLESSTLLSPGVFGGFPSSAVSRRLSRGDQPAGSGRVRHPRREAEWLPEGLTVDLQKLHRTYQAVVERAPKHNTRAPT